MNKKITNFVFLLYISLYSILSFLSITIFPYIHSDEPWLASLSNTYFQKGSTFVTEPFFDLMPRNAHAIKSLFHILQGLFIQVLGFNILSVRLISLLFAIGTLIIIYRIFNYNKTKGSILGLLITILLSLNEQFIYASHFARQEMILFFVLCLSYYLLIRLTTTTTTTTTGSGSGSGSGSDSGIGTSKGLWVIPLIIGFSIGFHPNAFIIASMIGTILLIDIFYKKLPIKALLIYVIILLIWASFYIVLSFMGNQNFIQDYLSYGSTLGVTLEPVSRFENFINFYIKLYYQISGTYYLVPLKNFFVALGIFIIAGIATIKYKKRELLSILSMFIAFNVAIFIIGRYNPTSILFLLFPSYLLFYHVSDILHTLLLATEVRLSNIKYLLPSILIIIILVNTNYIYSLNKTYSTNNYSKYEQSIETHLDNSYHILGNLSSGFIFENKEFYDIRNLAFLPDEDDAMLEYLIDREIDTIIYYEEYDYIHRNEKWQILYGNDDVYYDDLNLIINNYGSLIATIEPSIYGTRIITYMNDYPFKIMIYQIHLP